MTENRHEWEKEFYRNFVLKQNGDKEEVGFWSTSEEKAFHNAKRIIDFIAAEKARSEEEEREKIKEIIDKLVVKASYMGNKDDTEKAELINEMLMPGVKQAILQSLISNNITE